MLDLFLQAACLALGFTHLHMQRQVARRGRVDDLLRRPDFGDQIERLFSLVETSLQIAAKFAGKRRQIQCPGLGDGRAQDIALGVINLEQMVLHAGRQRRVARRRRRFRRQAHALRQIVHQLRRQTDDDKGEQLQTDERHHALVHLDGRHAGRGDAAQIEQGETEGRGQERGLNVQTNHHPQPHGGNVGRGVHQQDRRHDGHHHDGDFDEVQEEPHDEDDQHDDGELSPETAGHAGQEFTHQFLAAERTERGRQHRGANQNDEHQGRGLGGFNHHALQGVFDLPRPPATPADGKDQGRREKQAKLQAEPVEVAVDRFDVDLEIRADDRERDQGHQGDDRRVIGVPVAVAKAITAHDQRPRRTDGAGLVDRRDTGDDGTKNQEDQSQRRHQRDEHLDHERAVECALAVHGRRHFRFEKGQNQDIAHIQADQNQARHKGAQEHFTGAGRGHVEA